MLIQLYLLLKLSPRVQTHSSSIVLSWRSNRHVILNMIKTELLISTCKLDPPTEIYIHLINGIKIYPSAQIWKKKTTLIFFSFRIKRCLLFGRKAMTNLLKSRDITLPAKVRLVKPMVFPIVMYGCESWTIKKNWCFWTVVLEKILESPLDCKEIQPVHPKGNQSSIFIGRTDAEAETAILWPPDVKSWLIWKDPDAGKDWMQEEKGPRENEMVGWHHRLDGHEFGQALGAGDGQGGLACCSPWGRKESDKTEWLNWTELNW